MSEEVTPDAIMQLGMGFWGSKALLSAVELGLFTELASAGPLDPETLGERLGLHRRSARDFFDALVALGMLQRDDEGRYSNTPQTDTFLDRNKPTYVGGMLEMANARLYPFWGRLTEGLRTGEPQNEAKRGEDFFEILYHDPGRLRGFVEAMTGISGGAAQAMAARFPFGEHGSVADIGCAQGIVPIVIAKAHPHLEAIGFDLPKVQPLFEELVQRHGVEDRLRFVAGDFFERDLPEADVHIMGHILHDWDLDQKKTLLQKSYDALPEGGALIAYDAVIDDERRNNAFGLLMSLNMLIETSGGFDYTGAECQQWMKDVGFRQTRVEPLAGPDSMVIGLK